MLGMCFLLLRFRPACLCLLWFCGILLSAQSRAQVLVVSSVRPLQFIAAAIVVDADATYTINSGGSVHHRSLTPRDRLRLQQADLVLWIDPEVETHLAALLAGQSRRQTVIRITALPELTLHRFEQDRIDPHLWLNPHNALQIARQLQVKLSDLMPENAAAYRQRLQQFEAVVQAAWPPMVASLQSLTSTDYAVYHDAYRYFEQAVGISHSLSLLQNPELPPGLRDVPAIQQQVAAQDLRCIILEPDSSWQLVDTLTDQQAIRRVTIDPLGHQIPAGDQAYLQLLQQVTSGFQSCLAPGSADAAPAAVGAAPAG